MFLRQDKPQSYLLIRPSNMGLSCIEPNLFKNNVVQSTLSQCNFVSLLCIKGELFLHSKLLDLLSLGLLVSYLVTLLLTVSCAMANLSNKQVSLVSLVMLLVIVASSEARSSHGLSMFSKEVDSNLITFHKLGYDVSRFENYRRMLDSNPVRVSPGGPDPHHN